MSSRGGHNPAAQTSAPRSAARTSQPASLCRCPARMARPLGALVGDMGPMVMTFSNELGFDLLVSGWTIATNADYAFAWIIVCLAGFLRHGLG